MFGHGSWDTFRATTSSGNQVFHGFWNKVTSKTIDKWEVVNPEQCGETPLKVVVYVKNFTIILKCKITKLESI